MNFKKLLQNAKEKISECRTRRNASKIKPGQINFLAYHRYDVMVDYLQTLSEKYPTLITLHRPARSFENRSLCLAVIGREREQKLNPIIFIDGGMHGREWISPAVVMYIIKELVENEKYFPMIKYVDWCIVPVVNPDGYEYSHTEDRWWRKTRSPGKRTECIGVDPNRNFDYHWKEVGASSDECTEEYAGPRPFSEPETRYLRDQLLQFRERIKLYLSIHSCGQYILYPWGYTSEPAENTNELHNLAIRVTDAISSVANTHYVIGSSNSLVNSGRGVSGVSCDWVKGCIGVELCYVIELPCGGKHSFDLPPKRILPVCEEIFEGIKVFHNYISTAFIKSRKNILQLKRQ